jgi:alkylation response protein AidB-like acyl-CoA dehydrogenase
VCDALVVLEEDRLLLVPTPDDGRHPVANLGSAPLADVNLAGGTELTEGPAGLVAFESALDEWLVLTASALVGMGAAAHETVCRYAAERRAFGGVIGSYQGVAHPLAEDATRLDGARLLAQKAAWALDTHHPRSRELAALAFAVASETAERATYQAIHFHGGYGFMLEHDVQLFYRRARGWSRIWGSADDAYRRAATARYGTAHLRSA